MTTHRSGTTRGKPAPPRPPGELPYTALRTGRAAGPSAVRQRLGRIAHLAALVLGPVVLLSLAAAAVIYVRLIHGPVSLKSFSTHIEASINAELDGFRADIDDAVLTLAEDYTIELRLINLRLNDADGDVVASAPMAAVELDKGALWRLEANPARVYLIEPRLTVTYTDTQGFSLSISDANAGGAETPLVPPRPIPARPPASAGGARDALQPSFHRIDVARILAESSAHARRGTSHLRELGVRNATVSISYNGQMSEISVPEAAVDLEHSKRRSIISGTATIASEKGPWSLEVRMDEAGRRDTLKLGATVRDLVPSTLAKISPGFGLLAMLDTPIAGELALELSNDGDLKTANMGLDLGHGFVRLPSASDTPMLLDGGHLTLAYDADARRLTLAPSTFNWGESRVTLEGAVANDPAAGGAPEWQFGIRSTEGALAAEEFGVAPIGIGAFQASGRIIPSEGMVQLAGLSLKLGDGEVTANGEVISGGGSPSTRIEASLSSMPLATLKALWPRAAAAAARAWVGTQVDAAHIQAASFKLLSGRFVETDDPAGTVDPAAASGRQRLSAMMEVTGLRMQPLPKSLPIEASQAILRLENSTLEVTVPQAEIIVSETGRLPLSGGRFTVVDVTHDVPVAELALKSETSLATLIDTLNHSQLNLAGQGPLPIEGVDGRVEGEIAISMPLVSGASVVKIEGKARIRDIKGKSKLAGLDLQGGTIDIEASDAGVVAKGDLMLNGVLAKLQMQRILDAPPEMQPPIRISATLDNTDRTQLGLDVNHLVQGNVPVEITIAPKTDAPSDVHVRADLTGAELLFTTVAWRKAPGHTASLECDVDTSDPARTQLKNFRVVGDTIALDGWVAMNEKRELSEFSFPNFSLNVVSRLQVSGKINPQRIWKMTVKGSTFDARDLFRSLLALGKPADAPVRQLHPAAGVDVSATIDTVLGHSGISLRGYTAKISERGDQLVEVDAQGAFDGGKTLTVRLKPNGPRMLTAESDDAGQAFKLVGFYPNVQGGRLRLEIDLEGRGEAEKSGVLWVDNFRVLGDPIVSEVYSSAGNAPPDTTSRKRKVEREVFEFQRLKAPFSIGHGQFVLDDSYVRGPLLGASIRGKVDYNSRSINLGGTYVPLQGINSAFCEIPLVGPIVSGFDCQGVFGITYAIQGSMSQPQVLVNPLSMFTPGILRAIMEMTNPNPQVQAPREPERLRASSAESGVVDGWSSETTPTDGKKGAKKKKP